MAKWLTHLTVDQALRGFDSHLPPHKKIKFDTKRIKRLLSNFFLIEYALYTRASIKNIVGRTWSSKACSTLFLINTFHNHRFNKRLVFSSIFNITMDNFFTVIKDHCGNIIPHYQYLMIIVLWHVLEY